MFLSDKLGCGGQPPPPLRINMLMYYYAYITLYILAFLSASPYLPDSSTVPSGTYPQPAKAPVLSKFLFNFVSLLKSASPLRTLFSCCPTQMVLLRLSGPTNLWGDECTKTWNKQKIQLMFSMESYTFFRADLSRLSDSSLLWLLRYFMAYVNCI